jgi:hypothetical protein
VSLHSTTDPFIEARPEGERRTKVVERLAMHGTPIDFRTLCERAVPPETRYLVMDLDRTLHLRRNMGELLGWELVALWGYGEEHLGKLEGRPPGRLLLDFSAPKKLLRYLAVGGRIWAVPGLYYLVFGKLAAISDRARRLSYWLFGPEPVRLVQSVPQTTLLHLLSRLPLETLRILARGVWERHGDDQVIEREDIEWLRRRCPNLKIVVTSASPRPVLEVAAEMLGVDHVEYSTLEEHEGFLSAPLRLRRLLWSGKRPRRIAPPSTLRINSSYAKIEGLLAQYPDFCDADVLTVGITDTGYGEDHCWAEFFTRVVDINSDTPFPPVVSAESPLREVHSAAVLSRRERRMRAAGDATFLDPRRRPEPSNVDHVFTHEDLERVLGTLPTELETLASIYERHASKVKAAKRALELRSVEMHERIEAAVRAYNESPDDERIVLLDELDALAKQVGKLTRRMTRIERPLADAAYAFFRARDLSRRRLDEQLAPSSASSPT